MEIIAGLLTLDATKRLPVPWYCRAPLGLESGTAVEVGLTNPQEGRLPDIVVTPLKIHRLHLTTTVTIDVGERPGALASLLAEVGSPFNIALIESVTIESRSHHRVSLVLEPRSDEPVDNGKAEKEYWESVAQLTKRLAKVPDVGGNKVHRTSWPKPNNFIHQDSLTIKDGVVQCDRLLDFVSEQYGKKFGAEYHLDRVVASSNTERRFLRYIFPRKGAFDVRISHQDTPGALFQIAKALQHLKYNILLSRLSRTPGRNSNSQRKSLFVAVCEPETPPAEPLDSRAIETALKIELRKIKPRYQVNLDAPAVRFGGAPAIRVPSGRAPRYRSAVEVPGHIRELYDQVRESLGGQQAVFISARKKTTRVEAKQLFEAIELAIRDCGLVPIDGFERPWKLDQSIEIQARMWCSAACIVLAWDGRDNQSPGLGVGQIHEIGYMSGQGKPYNIVVGKEGTASVDPFNFEKKALLDYDDVERAVDTRGGSESVRTKVKDWLSLQPGLAGTQLGQA